MRSHARVKVAITGIVAALLILLGIHLVERFAISRWFAFVPVLCLIIHFVIMALQNIIENRKSIRYLSGGRNAAQCKKDTSNTKNNQ